MLALAASGWSQTGRVMVIEQTNGPTLRLGLGEVKQITFENEEEDPNAYLQIDNTFTPTLEWLQGGWRGEYDGWDARMRTICHIRRHLQLNTDGTYHNFIQGVFEGAGQPGMTDFVDFEREHGTYSFNASTRTFTYTVTSDSLIDFRTQEMIGYTKKHYFDHEAATYTETPQFTKEVEGKRKWIAYDESLASPEDKKSAVLYVMEKDLKQ